MKNGQQFQNDFEQFVATGFYFTAKDDSGKWTLAEALDLLRGRTVLYVEKHNSGISSLSAFEIVLKSLVAEGQLKPMKLEEEPRFGPQIPADIADFIAKAERGEVSTFELRRRYMSDRTFRDAYDVHTGLASLATPRPIEMTVAEYRSIPARTIQIRYQKNPGFKLAVDKLIQDGLI